MMLVGLTGGIAAGKSTVARELAACGLPVVDADQIARDVVAPGAPLLAEVAREFGAQVIGADGALDRKALGAIVFDDADARRRLEALTHPAIARASMERFKALADEGHEVAIYEAALLVETKRHQQMSALVVVTADDEVRIARIIERDGLTREEAQKRIAAQMPQQDKAELADYVIDNSDGLETTRARARALAQALRERARLRPEPTNS
ncbi:MAG: dephospho-CoA kinase [Myxococcales bacterium]|nr:dephospho-CoA kinase [Myxococcales bacterium]